MRIYPLMSNVYVNLFQFWKLMGHVQAKIVISSKKILSSFNNLPKSSSTPILIKPHQYLSLQYCLFY
jgi:hypothetical protein